MSEQAVNVDQVSLWGAGGGGCMNSGSSVKELGAFCKCGVCDGGGLIGGVE